MYHEGKNKVTHAIMRNNGRLNNRSIKTFSSSSSLTSTSSPSSFVEVTIRFHFDCCPEENRWEIWSTEDAFYRRSKSHHDEDGNDQDEDKSEIKRSKSISNTSNTSNASNSTTSITNTISKYIFKSQRYTKEKAYTSIEEKIQLHPNTVPFTLTVYDDGRDGFEESPHQQQHYEGNDDDDYDDDFFYKVSRTEYVHHEVKTEGEQYDIGEENDDGLGWELQWIEYRTNIATVKGYLFLKTITSSRPQKQLQPPLPIAIIIISINKTSHLKHSNNKHNNKQNHNHSNRRKKKSTIIITLQRIFNFIISSSS